MALSRWFRSFCSVKQAVDRRTRDVRRLGVRVCVEELELREVPATLTLGLTPSPVNEGQSTTLNGTIGDPPADPFAVLINWGDGQKQTVNLNGGATSFSTNHLFVDDNPTATPSDTHTITGDLYTIDGTQITFGSAVRLGAGGIDNAASVALDASGNVYTLGYFEGTVDFDPGAGTVNLTSNGLFDVFVTKSDMAGNLIWAKSFGGGDDDLGMSIAVDAVGNVIVVGSFLDLVDFDPGPDTFELASAGSLDAFVVKLSGDGTFVWAKSFGGLEADSANGVAIGPSGSIHITGGFADTVDFDPGAGTFELTSAGNADAFVVKLTSGGTLDWAGNLGGTFAETGTAIAVDAAGSVYLTGTFGDQADFDPGPGQTLLVIAGGNDAFLCKLTSAGNLAWAYGFGGVDFDYGTSLALDASGNVYASGNFYDAVDFNPGVGDATRASAGDLDAYVVKFTPAGEFVWVSTVGGIDLDSGNGLALDRFGNVYLTGNFTSTADFDPGAGTTSLTAIGNFDAFTLKLSNAGAFVWVQQQGGSDSEVGNAIAVNGLSDVYVVGGFGGTADFNPTAGTFNLVASGESDAFVSRLLQSMLATNASKNVTVNNVAPTVLAGPDGFIQPGGTFTQAGSFTDPSSTDTFTATVNYGDGSGVQPLTLNPNGTYSLNHTYASIGLYTVTVSITDDDTGVGNDTVRVFVGTPPSVENMIINGGAVQRSMVKTLQVNFSSEVNIGNGAFSIRNPANVALGVTINVNTQVISGKTVATLTFVNANPTIVGGSLPDGRWRLRIDSSLITDISNGLPMAFDYVSAEFIRYFGNTDSDQDVDNLDFARFRVALNTPANYRADLDFEADGDVDNLDFARFRLRLNVPLP